MTKKKMYPIEAFALAAVLFSTGMKEAMIVGIGLIFGDVLQYVLRENGNTSYIQTASAIGAVLTGGAIYGMEVLTGTTPDIKQLVGLALLGVLLIRHHEAAEAEPDYGSVLTADSVAYGGYVLLALIREYLAGGEIFGVSLPETMIISSAFAKPMFALIGAGILIAALNRILKTECEKNAALWVGIPVILLEVPFVWNHAVEWLGSLIGIVTVGIVYVTLRRKLAFSNTEKHIEGLPVELVMLGIIYMVFGLL